MLFRVSVLTTENHILKLELEAADASQAQKKAESLGHFVASVKPSGFSLKSWLDQLGAQGQDFSLLLFSQELLALLHAGLSIVEAIEALQEKELNRQVGDIYTQLLSGLREGKRFSTVLAEQALIFPPLFVGIVKSAEGTSNLPRSIARYIDYQLRIDTVRNKLISSAIYPVILMVVGFAVSFFLVIFVVPRFADVYQGSGRQLPWLSEVLLSVGLFLSDHLWTFLSLTGALIFWVLRANKGSAGQSRVLSLASRLPSIAQRLKIYELSRLYLTMGMLMEGGIPAVHAMQTVAGMVSEKIRFQLLEARQKIESGESISAAFETHQLTTPISLRLLRVGEKTGDMGSMLMQSAAFYDGEITRWVERFTRMFEPLLMAIIGIVVGLIVVLLYMPIFDLAGSIS
jgi:general secretion pathway protein F